MLPALLCGDVPGEPVPGVYDVNTAHADKFAEVRPSSLKGDWRIGLFEHV